MEEKTDNRGNKGIIRIEISMYNLACEFNPEAYIYKKLREAGVKIGQGTIVETYKKGESMYVYTFIPNEESNDYQI